MFFAEKVFAQQTYYPLVPQVQSTANQLSGGASAGNDLSALLNQWVYLIIGVAVVLAIFMIIRGGYGYMTSSDNANKKTEAKNRIKAAFGGLLLALGTVLILNTINPNITRFVITFPALQRPTEPPEPNEVAYNPSTGGPVPEYSGDVSWVDWNNPNQRLTENFTVRDVTKGQSSRIPQTEQEMRRILAMANELENVRAQWGGGIAVNSWYRPPDVNASVGGASGSQHINGIAVDIYPTNGNLQEFQSWLSNNWSGGVGIYDSFIHIDMRGGGRLDGGSPSARW